MESTHSLRQKGSLRFTKRPLPCAEDSDPGPAPGFGSCRITAKNCFETFSKDMRLATEDTIVLAVHESRVSTTFPASGDLLKNLQSSSHEWDKALWTHSGGLKGGIMKIQGGGGGVIISFQPTLDGTIG